MLQNGHDALLRPGEPGRVRGRLEIRLVPDPATFRVLPWAPGNGWVSTEPGRVVADARLVNVVPPLLANLPTPANFALTAASPAVNAGAGSAGISQDFFGDTRADAVDIGADELGGNTQFSFPANMAALAPVE